MLGSIGLFAVVPRAQGGGSGVRLPPQPRPAHPPHSLNTLVVPPGTPGSLKKEAFDLASVVRQQKSLFHKKSHTKGTCLEIQTSKRQLPCILKIVQKNVFKQTEYE